MNRNSSDYDGGIGKSEYIYGTGKFKRLIGRKCNLAVKYIEEFSFYRHRCK